MEDNNKNFEQVLLDNGFKEYKDVYSKCSKSFGKTLYDEKGKKYMVICKQYNHSKYIEKSVPDSYTFNVQFRLDKKDKDQVINIEFSADMEENEWRTKTNLEEVEMFFESMFLTTKADYYELYD